MLPLRALPPFVGAAVLLGMVYGPNRAWEFVRDHEQFAPLVFLAVVALHFGTGWLYGWQVRRIMFRRASEESPEVTGEVRGRDDVPGESPAPRPNLTFARHGREAARLTDRPEELWITERLLNRGGRILGRAVAVAWVLGLATHGALMATVFDGSPYLPEGGAFFYVVALIGMVALQMNSAGFRPPSALLAGVGANGAHLFDLIDEPTTHPFDYLVLLPLVVWFAVVLFGLLPASRGHAHTPPRASAPRLLLLRTFGLSRLTSTLFGLLGRRWALLGPSVTIADPSLAQFRFRQVRFWLLGTCLAPGVVTMVFSLVEGREETLLGSLGSGLEFVSVGLSFYPVLLVGCFLIASAALLASAPHNTAALENRLSLETRGSLAARFPVIKLSCYDDRWQETVDRLIVWCDVVVMDARGFTPEKAGVAYELGVILAGFPLDRTVFLVDASTDEAYLEETMQAAWRALPAELGTPTKVPRVHLYVARAMGRRFRREVPGLVALLAEVTATAPGRPTEEGGGTPRALGALSAVAWVLAISSLTRTASPPIDWSLDLPGVLLLGGGVLAWMVSTRARIAMSVEGGLRRFFASPTWNVSILTVVAVVVYEAASVAAAG
ncbi:MAG: hypothetical protein KDA24_21255 [Deltaproteobacteria bacterium]|nr:hypothetical protein [Deltaproteobacteria bacterium]